MVWMAWRRAASPSPPARSAHSPRAPAPCRWASSARLWRERPLAFSGSTRMFMGDVGSQALGAALAAAGIVAKMELAVLIVGGLFVAEALSVILQVACFKATGRRLFRMSPFHHHFELSGWTETQTVVRFWICGALLAALGVGLGS